MNKKFFVLIVGLIIPIFYNLAFDETKLRNFRSRFDIYRTILRGEQTLSTEEKKKIARVAIKDFLTFMAGAGMGVSCGWLLKLYFSSFQKTSKISIGSPTTLSKKSYTLEELGQIVTFLYEQKLEKFWNIGGIDNGSIHIKNGLDNKIIIKFSSPNYYQISNIEQMKEKYPTLSQFIQLYQDKGCSIDLTIYYLEINTRSNANGNGHSEAVETPKMHIVFLNKGWEYTIDYLPQNYKQVY